MSKVESEIKEASGLEDIGNLFPPSAFASQIANVLMKLPAFWPDAAELYGLLNLMLSSWSEISTYLKLSFTTLLLFSLRMLLLRRWISSMFLLLEILTRFSKNGWLPSTLWMITSDSRLWFLFFSLETRNLGTSDEQNFSSSPGWL